MSKEFQTLLNQEKLSDLKRMFILLSRIPKGLDSLKVTFEAHVKRCGLAAIERISFEKENPQHFVDALLGVHSQYSRLVSFSFNDESGFVASLDKACRDFVNHNSICSAGSKCPELLARYCDLLLKKGSKIFDENRLDTILGDIVMSF